MRRPLSPLCGVALVAAPGAVLLAHVPAIIIEQMNRTITYAIDKSDGLVYSRIGSMIAVPVLQWDKIGADGDYTAPLEYQLERCSVYELSYYWSQLRWTKKIPVEIKNLHRSTGG